MHGAGNRCPFVPLDIAAAAAAIVGAASPISCPTTDSPPSPATVIPSVGENSFDSRWSAARDEFTSDGRRSQMWYSLLVDHERHPVHAQGLRDPKRALALLK